MTDRAPGTVGVTFAKGVLDDVAELTTPPTDSDQAVKEEAETLKRRIAELLVECKDNPFIGELMGPGLRPRASQLSPGPVRHPNPRRETALPPDLPQRTHRRRPC
ncbi:MAG TPA: hypothetical protein VFP21_06190 [Solirubrobacterales bacterium]|nr:hypothetical protein [Solirubrobacterales bacterium]